MDSIKDRIRAAIGDEDVTKLGRRAGIPSSTMHAIAAGSMPKADTAVRLARALGCSVEWLVAGDEDAPSANTLAVRRAGAQVELGASAEVMAFDSAGWLKVPDIDLKATLPGEALHRVGDAIVRREDVARFGAPENLWVTRKPGGGVPEVAMEGATILCSDPEQPLVDGAAYIWRLGRALVVRRFLITTDEWEEDADGKIAVVLPIGPDETKRLPIEPIGRVLAVLKVDAA